MADLIFHVDDGAKREGSTTKSAATFNNDGLDQVYSTETDLLIPSEVESSGASPIHTTWKHWTIGLISSLYFYSFISSYYLNVEYTNKVTLDEEFEAANLSESNITSDTCTVNTSGLVYETQARATEKASTWILYYSLAQGIPSIFSNLILGSYTDALGRKFLLVIGIVGTFVRLLLSTMVIYFEAPLFYLVLACLVDGFTGQYVTSLQTALAYVSDITTVKTRTLGMIFVELVLGVSLSSASFATGYIVGSYGYFVPVVISSGMLFLDLVLVLLILPETRPKEIRQKRASIWRMLLASSEFFIKEDGDKKRWKYQLILLVHFLCNISFLARIPTETLFQMSSPFCWSAEKVGVYAAIRTLVIMFIGLGLVSLIQRCLDEVTLCMMGAISYAAAFYWTAFVQDDVTWYLIIGVGSFGAVGTTMQRSLLSLLTSADKQGAIFSAVGALEVVSSLVSNASTSAIYSATVTTMRGFVFLVMGSYNTICLMLLVVLKVGWHMERKKGTKNY